MSECKQEPVVPWRRQTFVPSLVEAGRTDKLYFPSGVTLEEASDEELRRGLCFKSGGRLAVCAGCKGCAFGRELARRESCEK